MWKRRIQHAFLGIVIGGCLLGVYLSTDGLVNATLPPSPWMHEVLGDQPQVRAKQWNISGARLMTPAVASSSLSIQQDVQQNFSDIDVKAPPAVLTDQSLADQPQERDDPSHTSQSKPALPTPLPLNFVSADLSAQGKSLLSRCLVPPSNKSYRFRKYKPEVRQHASQYQQSQDVDKLLEGMTSGFVVESGALDGESLSNSVFFEVHRKWDCLLVEANPSLQDRILSLNRRCHLLKGGLSLTKNISSFKFILAQAVGGIVDTMAPATIQGIQSKIKKGQMKGQASSGEIIDVPCFPLHHVLHALGRKVVDYWSLDTEGSETKILQATDFEMIEVGVMTIEHQGSVNRRKAIYRILTEKGFIRVKQGGSDDVYVGKKYCKRRRMKIEACA